MGTARWSDRALREFIRRLDSREWWHASDEFREAELGALDAEVRVRIAAPVQHRVLAKIGALVDPDGIAIVTLDLIQYDDGDERRWLLVSTDPWGYLADWVAAAIVSAYKGAKGTQRVHAKQLDGLEKSLESAD